MSNKKTTTTSKETAVTTPNTPDYIQGPVNTYYAGVNNYLNQTPESTVTPANALQNNAFAAAAGLGGNAGGYGTAMNAITGLLGSSSPLAQAPNPFSAAGVSPAAQAQATNVSPATGYNPTNATSQGYDPTNASAQGYNAVKAAAAQATGAQGYNPLGVSLGGYDASLLGNTSNYLGNNVERVTGATLLDNLDAYKNPATQALVDATMAEYDNNAGIARAQMKRQAAGSGAFGGSRYGIAEGQFEADTGRNRALTDAELRASAFDRATSLSGQDADRRQNASVFNAGSQNTLDLARGQMGFQGALANQDATNSARQFGANATNTGLLSNQSAANQAAQFGANANNQFALTNAGFQQDANLANAGAANTANQFGANAANAVSMANAGAANQAGQFGANAANTAGLANAGAANSASQFGANATNAVNIANAAAANDMSRFNVGESNQNARQDAAATNNINSLIYGTGADMSKFNANLGQQDRQLDLNAAGLLGQLTGQQSADQRANLGAQLDAGNAQWSLQDQQTQARLKQLMAAGGLLNPSMMAALTGQTITSDGTNTSKQSGGLLQSLLSAGASLGSAAIMASERRVKRDIALVGREPDGLGVYDFRYVWDRDDAPLHRGTMVDEVERLRPWALGPVVDGIQTVNMGAL